MIVLDCSAAVNIVRRTEEGMALVSFVDSNEDVVSSGLLLIELASAFGKYTKAGLIDTALAVEYIQGASSLVDKYIPIGTNYMEAFYESVRLNHSVYDMLYFTLARRNNATLITLDQKLMRLCLKQGIDCVHIVDV
jgi:predicted nucleic acid-binding protein